MDRQCMKVLQYMKDYKTITTLDAYKDLGVSRLSARVWDLRNKYGYDIGVKPKKVLDRDGVRTTVNAYYLEDKNGRENEVYK